MKIRNPKKRLHQFWGRVDQKHIDCIIEHLHGYNILDLGCGLGTTTNKINSLPYNCIGIDYDADAINYCKREFSQYKYQLENAEKLSFQDADFDTIILRDSLHHLLHEADFKKVQAEILRVSKPQSRIIFFDPNVNFILRMARKLSFHKDQECSYEAAKHLIKRMGYNVIHSSFNTVYSLPLSGGYVGINFVPNIPLLHKFILKSELILERIIFKLGLSKNLCWRYILVGEKQ